MPGFLFYTQLIIAKPKAAENLHRAVLQLALFRFFQPRRGLQMPALCERPQLIQRRCLYVESRLAREPAANKPLIKGHSLAGLPVLVAQSGIRACCRFCGSA